MDAARDASAGDAARTADAGPAEAPWRTDPAPRVGADVLPIGVYHTIYEVEEVPAIAAIGFNAVMPYADGCGDWRILGNATTPGYLPTAAAHGVRFIAHAEPAALNWQPDAGCQPATRPAPESVVDRFAPIAGDPNVLAWYLFDEPDIWSVPPAEVRRAYDAIHALDPRPVVLVFSTRTTDATPWAGTMDVFAVDSYPLLPTGSHDVQLAAYRGTVETTVRTGAGADAVWMVLQGWADAAHAVPTTSESRYMLYTALLGGVRGVLWYLYRPARRSWFETVLGPVVRELHGYARAIAAGSVGPVTASDASVQASLYRDPGSSAALLVAVNHSATATTAALTLPIDASRAQGLHGAADTAITARRLDVALGPWAVATFELDPR